MDAARQGRRSNQRAAPGWDEDVDLMTGDQLADPLEITVLVIGLEPVAVDPGVCGTVIVGALMGYADEDVERGVGDPHQTSNGGNREAPVEPHSCFAGPLRFFMNARRPTTRSEGRRVGKESASTVNSRWEADQ